MILKIHPAIATILIAGIIILLFLLIKGCSNSRQAIAVNKDLQAKNDSLIAKTVKDSIERTENKKGYETALDLLNGQVEIKDNQLARTETELNVANVRISFLLAKHKDILPNPDSTNTYVPNDFITDCNGCFTELSNGQKLVQQYKSDNDQLKLSLRIKEKLQTDRIAQQELEKGKIAKSLQDCMDISKSAIGSGKPKGQLYFSWNVIWSPLPIGASVGLLYQNKRKMQYGLRWGYGSYGQAVETEINLPLSFKKR